MKGGYCRLRDRSVELSKVRRGDGKVLVFETWR